jgi:hypothetical protein
MKGERGATENRVRAESAGVCALPRGAELGEGDQGQQGGGYRGGNSDDEGAAWSWFCSPP